MPSTTMGRLLGLWEHRLSQATGDSAPSILQTHHRMVPLNRPQGWRAPSPAFCLLQHYASDREFSQYALLPKSHLISTFAKWVKLVIELTWDRCCRYVNAPLFTNVASAPPTPAPAWGGGGGGGGSMVGSDGKNVPATATYTPPLLWRDVCSMQRPRASATHTTEGTASTITTHHTCLAPGLRRLQCWVPAVHRQPPPPPAREGILGYGTCAQAAISTKAQKENGLISGPQGHRYLSVARDKTRRGKRADHRQLQRGGHAAVRQRPSLSSNHWTCNLSLFLSSNRHRRECWCPAHPPCTSTLTVRVRRGPVLRQARASVQRKQQKPAHSSP